MTDQAELDRKNSTFWNELCGTQLAISLGISDDTPQSLARFDAWYFDYYPYLFRHIPFHEMKEKEVLEIGLGYGTVAQRIAESGAIYHGLDIAAGPIAMVSRRLEHLGVSGDLRQGSILEPPFAPASFDCIVAIGCLHHTGNLAGAIEQVRCLLKPGGMASIMVYNATSYRQWTDTPLQTWRRARGDPATYRQPTTDDARMRGAYDANADGVAAPQTEFVTLRELRHMCRNFRNCIVVRENIGADGIFSRIPRKIACRLAGPVLGLDLYCTLEN